MKLFLISQDERHSYDTYDSAVVCAETHSDARHIHPSERDVALGKDGKWDDYSWASIPENVQCKYLGQARRRSKRGVICASFNAG